MTGEVSYSQNNDVVVELCKSEADSDFYSEKYHCAEAVLAAIRKYFSPETPEAVIKLVSGLGQGSGDGCICGAVSGGTIALGMVLPEDKERVVRLSKELHDWFKKTHRVTCCRVLLDKKTNTCPVSPGAVAGKIAEMLLIAKE